MSKYGVVQGVIESGSAEAERSPVPLPPRHPMDAATEALSKPLAVARLLRPSSVERAAFVGPNAMDGQGELLRQAARLPKSVPAALRPRAGIRFGARMGASMGANFGAGYTPVTSSGLYSAAITGFLAGVYTASDFSSAPQTASAYAPIVAEAVAFGQAVDAAIGALALTFPPTTGQIAFVGEMAQSVAFNKWSQGLTSTNYAGVAAAIAALYSEAAGSLPFTPYPEITGSVNLTTVTHGVVVTDAVTLIAVPTGDAVNILMNVLGRVTKVGTGGGESLGDSYGCYVQGTLKNVGGTCTVVPNVTGGTLSIQSDTSMADAVVTFQGSGANAQIVFENGKLIGSGAIVKWTYNVFPEGA